jgi:hypothetical protein
MSQINPYGLMKKTVAGDDKPDFIGDSGKPLLLKKEETIPELKQRFPEEVKKESETDAPSE